MTACTSSRSGDLHLLNSNFIHITNKKKSVAVILIQLIRTNKNSSNHIRGKWQVGVSDTTKDGVIRSMLSHPVEVFFFLKESMSWSWLFHWSAVTFPDLHWLLLKRVNCYISIEPKLWSLWLKQRNIMKKMWMIWEN